MVCLGSSKHREQGIDTKDCSSYRMGLRSHAYNHFTITWLAGKFLVEVCYTHARQAALKQSP